MLADSIPQSILVAEDNGQLRSWLQKVLEYAGYAVMEAANGRELMDILRRTSVHLCITDLAMPEQEGIETIQMIRSEYPEMKIIVISGAGPEMLQVSRKLGATASLSKPVDVETLLKTVREVLAASNPQSGHPKLA